MRTGATRRGFTHMRLYRSSSRRFTLYQSEIIPALGLLYSCNSNIEYTRANGKCPFEMVLKWFRSKFNTGCRFGTVQYMYRRLNFRRKSANAFANTDSHSMLIRNRYGIEFGITPAEPLRPVLYDLPPI